MADHQLPQPGTSIRPPEKTLTPVNDNRADPAAASDIQRPLADSAASCLLTYVVAIHNVRGRSAALEDFLSQCLLHSGQVQVVVVDDASDDDSFGLLCQLTAGLPNIAVTHSPRQQGPGLARNIGLSLAKAEYVAFADDDDLPIVAGALSLAEQAKDVAADVAWGLYEVEPLTEGVAQSEARRRIWGPSVQILDPSRREVAVWSFVFRLAFLRSHHLRFRPWMYGEDLTFLVEVAELQPRVLSGQYITYSYRPRRDSLSSSTGLKSIEALPLLDFLSSSGHSVRESSTRNYLLQWFARVSWRILLSGKWAQRTQVARWLLTSPSRAWITLRGTWLAILSRLGFVMP